MDPNSPNPEADAPLEQDPSTQESSSPEQDLSEPAAEASQDTEQAEGAEGEPAEDAEETPAPPKESGRQERKGGFQRKIERLERQLEQALALARGQAPQPPPQEQRQLTDAEKVEKDLDDFVAQRVQRQLAQERQAAEQRRMQEDLQKQLTEARARHEDFDDALADVAHIQVPPYLNEAILTSEHKAEIMYSLAKSPAELARICALPPLQAALVIGRLEAKLASGASQPTPKATIRPPAPPSKVVGSVKPTTRNLEDLSVSEYKAAMRSRGRR